MDSVGKWDKQLGAKYGITAEEVRALRMRPFCDACGEPFEEGTHGLMTRHIDHDHETGRVRGVLHHRCNTSLGLLRDDPLLLAKLVGYLHGRRAGRRNGVYVYGRRRNGKTRWLVEVQSGGRRRYATFHSREEADCFRAIVSGETLLPARQGESLRAA